MDADALASHALLITHFDPKSPVAEAYRTLRTNIQFARLERAGKVLVVTSPTLQEGKTTTIVNLALTMAQNGQRTLLVGANLRRPSIYRFFGIDREPGLADVLVGNARWQDCLRTVADILMGRFEMEDIMASPGLDNLHIIEAGPVPANPSELLSTPAMAAFLREVREQYDIVLVDTPPVLPVTDSAFGAAHADGALLVYQAGKVGRLVLKRAKIHLESARAKVWGVVLNDVQTEIAGYAYAHYYTHYYGEETAGEPPRGRLERAWQSLRERFSRGAVTADVGRDVDIESPGLIDDVRREPSRRSGRARDSHRSWMLLLVVAALAALGGAAFLWGAGWAGGDLEPRALFRKKIETLPSRPSGERAVPAPAPAPPAPVAPRSSTDDEVAPGGVPSPRAEPSPTPLSAAGLAPVPPLPPADARPAPPSTRFAVELGPFATTVEADRVERRLNQAGYQTVRFRQQTGGAVFAILIENLPTAHEAQALIATLRDQGLADAVVVGGAEPVTVRVGEPLPLRGAVQLAERLRTSGHVVRVAAQPGEATTVTIRHGNFASRDQAAAKGDDLRRLGLPNQVVRIR
jgi:Mrp family chromosome partitioning ATPase